MTERSEGAADEVGVAAKRPTERSARGKGQGWPCSGSEEGAANEVGAAAKRPNFLDELKRPNVIRMAGLYLVGAWLLIQIAETLLPRRSACERSH
jgi:hypothetical protein